jgi:hypothetical protein
MPVVGDFDGDCEVADGEAGVFVGATAVEVGVLVALVSAMGAFAGASIP